MLFSNFFSQDSLIFLGARDGFEHPHVQGVVETRLVSSSCRQTRILTRGVQPMHPGLAPGDPLGQSSIRLLTEGLYVESYQRSQKKLSESLLNRDGH